MSGSHNPLRPSYISNANYLAFYERVERAFTPDSINEKDLAEWLRNPNHPLIDIFLRSKQISNEIQQTTSLEDLGMIKDEISTIPIHNNELKTRLYSRIEEVRKEIRQREEKERKIAESITKLNDFARRRKINLSDKTYGNVYQNWGRWHRPAIVIFKSGKILTWEYIK